MTSHVIIPCSGGHCGLGAMTESIQRYSPQTPTHIIPLYGPDVERLAEIYEHTGPNCRRFQLACFQRWFAARDFVSFNQIESFWIMDWDTLVFCDLAAEAETVHRDAFPLNIWYCREPDLLDHWCEEIMQLFTHQEKKARLLSLYPHLADMYLAQALSDPSSPTIFGPKNGKAFDSNLALSENGYDLGDGRLNQSGYEMEEGMKKLSWEDGYPYANYRGQRVRMLTLQCWSEFKKRMWEFLEKGKPPNYE